MMLGRTALLIPLVVGAPVRPRAVTGTPRSPHAPIVSVTVHPDTVAVGGVVTIAGRIENPAADTLVLSYPSTCQHDLLVTTDTGRQVYPGLRVCGTMLTSRRLAPGEVIADTLRLRTTGTLMVPDALHNVDPPTLGPGRYRAQFVASPEWRSRVESFVVRY